MHSPNPDSNYDVFLSSRSRDTDEEPFTSHLYTSLQKAGISVFWDDDGLLSGDEQILPSIVQAIQRSRISVVVLSEGYAGSRRCLEVLEQIIECRRNAGQFLLPVFLGISREDVLYQSSGFGNAFDDLTNRITDKDKVEGWRLSFSRICQIQSYIRVELQKDPCSSRSVDGNKRWCNDNEVEDVVERAKNLLDRADLSVAEHLEGIARLSRFIPVPYFINQKPEGVLLIGIWGMVGIGKTTLAKAIYNHNHEDFEGISFLASIREVWKQDTGHVYLQERLLSDVYKLPRKKIESIEIGKKMLEEKLSHKKILLVLDDVNKLEQLNALCGSHQWFGPGSMIIITTRDRSLLREWVLGVEHEHVFNMIEMDNKESGDLINWYAGRESAKRDFRKHSRKIIAYSGGLPLALEVLGSSIFERPGAILDRLEKFPDPMVLKVLKSYINDLHNIEKDIFLDIAFFLIGMDRVKVIETLNAFGDLAEKGTSALEDNGLVTFDTKNKVAGMNVLLRETGREIIREQMRAKPGSRIYDVVLSFKGEDTWVTFTSHLYTHLANANINFFKKDDDQIRRGDRISISQLQAIGRSRVCVVVLSKHYANSRWCLQELEKIMECYKTIGQVVVPIFYGVDPSTVHNQIDEFGKAFQNLLETISVESDKEKSWRIALSEIGNIAGIEIPVDSRKERDEDIKNAIEHVTHSLDMFVVEHPVGLKAQVQDVIQLLNCKMSKDVLLLGIWGMGGSGKTTLVKAIYNILSRKYEGRSFLQDISDIWKQDNGRVCLQEKLLSDINTTTNVKKDDMKPGKRMLCERLCHEGILLVLDDVDDLEQLNALCGSREWFGSDSIIIITTRDKRLLNELGVGHVYRMKEMDESESAMLLSWHAFKQPSPREDFAGLCKDVVAHCGGLPLALEVLGCELFGKDESEWKSLMHRYTRIPHPIIQNVLKRSFDGLGDDRVKNVFLEIACFFVGLDQNEAIQKLNGFEDHLAATSVPVLVEQSLVTVDEMNRLGMHVLLQHTAREIFRQRSGMPSIYDVFFSFSIDTPSSFTSCLIDSLEKAEISVFRNDNLFTGGDHILPSVLQVIQRCRISMVVLSEGYTGSRRCLEVLEQIIERSRIAGQFVLPVFFGMSRYQLHYRNNGLGEAFDDLTKRISDKDKVESWKIALARISSRHYDVNYNMIDHWHNNDEHIEDIKKIVKHAKGLLDRTDLFIAEYPVGVESRVRDACQVLFNEKDKDVLLLGLWGMVGIGKTAIAKAIYNQIGGNFEGRSFLPNIREVWEQDRRHVYLQELLLSDVYKLPIIKIDSIKIGKKILKNKLSHKRVFLVLDDVNKLEQLDALCGSREWFGPGSVIIITTRDRSLLRALKVDHVYRIKEMNKWESLQLLDKWSPKFGHAPHYKKQILVASIGGLPLALEVEILVSDALYRLKEFPHTVVQKVVKTCINDLNDTEKDIFFDIACFLNGMDHEEAMEALNAFKLASNGMRALEDRCFVTIDEKNRLKMHVILRDVGRKIIQEQMKVEPGSWIYDVFLSFRGEDTRKIFTSPLHASLVNAGIHVFKDDNELRRGDRISIKLLQAIKRSRISVVVLSRHYADSRWCLQELEYIMECRRTIGQVVLPVFYDVDPSSVRNQTRMFGEAFQDLLKKFIVEKDKEKEKSWRRALHDIGSIVGVEIIKFRDNNEGINQIVEDITHWLDKSTFIVAEHPVGLESRVQSVIKLLHYQQSKDVQLLGISGIGGIGKTTIAKAIYNQIRHDFDGSCFLLDIREFWKEMTSRLHLQEQILFYVLKKRERINNIESGKIILRERLHHKRVLLILDDVDKSDQLKALCWSREWFGLGSRIIITTRDDGLLKVLKVDHKYKMSEMDNGESIEHFSWHAFKQASPKEDFTKLSRDVVAYCGGLPLALEVIGSLLFDENAKIWQSVLEKLKIIPNEEVQKKLRVSFDGLGDDTEKEIFLDIAFFFIGIDRNDVMHILDGYHPEVGISNLIDRNLVSVDKNNKLRVHGLLRAMGKQIVREESLKKPEKRSRLWLQKDVLKVLQNYTGTEAAVEGLTLNLAGINKFCLKTETFKKMEKLRLLQLHGVPFEGNFEYLSEDLTWLYWHRFPLDYIAPNFDKANLVALELESSSLISMWKEAQILEKLKVLNLSHSHRLTQTPDFSYLPNLEKLLLKDCPSLSAVSETIGDLKNILLINFEKCTRLPNLPRSFYKLKSLDTLIISGCSMINKLEEDVEQMESLITLLAHNTGIKQVPFSMVRSKSIGYISMCGYDGFSCDVFPSLIWSWMSPTNILSFSSFVQSSFVGLALVSLNVPEFGSLCWVRSGSDHKQGLVRILNILRDTYCKVSSIRSSSLTDMGMKSQVTEILREIILQKLTSTNGFDDCLLPSDNYPALLSFNFEDSSVIFEFPYMNGCNVKKMFRIVYSSSPDTIISECVKTVLIKNYTKSTIQVYKRDTLASFEDDEWQSLLSTMDPGNSVEVSRHRFIVKKTIVYPISNAPTNQNMEQQKVALVSCGTNFGGDENSAAARPGESLSDMGRPYDLIDVDDKEKGDSSNSSTHHKHAHSEQDTTINPDETMGETAMDKGDLSVNDYLIDDITDPPIVKQEASHDIMPVSIPADLSIQSFNPQVKAPIMTNPPIHEEDKDDDEDDDDDEFDMGFLNTLNLALSNSIIVKDTPSVFEARSVKSTVTLTTEMFKSPTPTSNILIPSDLPVDQLLAILSLLNHPFEALVKDGDLKQKLVEATSSLSQASLPDQHQHLVSSLSNFIIQSFDSLAMIQSASEHKQKSSEAVDSILKNIDKTRSQKTKVIEGLQHGESCENELVKEIQGLQAQIQDLTVRKDNLTRVLIEGRQHLGKFDKRLDKLAKEEKIAKKQLEEANSTLKKVELTKEIALQLQQDLKLKLRCLFP